MFEIIGIAGIAISMAAYLPQVVHLAREHCSAGVSTRAWTMWLVSALFVGMLAVIGAIPYSSSFRQAASRAPLRSCTSPEGTRGWRAKPMRL
jgi:uncharacterized protein with PQ loop repeat